MYYNEFVNRVKGLNKKYTVGRIENTFIVCYGNTSVLSISTVSEYGLYLRVSTSDFKKLPYNRNLWMVSNELTMTPIDERDKENLMQKKKTNELKHNIEIAKKKLKYYEKELHKYGNPAQKLLDNFGSSELKAWYINKYKPSNYK